MADILGLGRISKEDISLETIQRDLRIDNPEYIKRARMGKYIPYEIPRHLDFYYEDTEHYYVPRYYNKDVEKQLELGDKVDFSFDITLRDYQEKYFKDNKILESKTGSFVMNLKTGNGKTVCGLYLINKLQRRTLVVCETRYLISQWVSRIKSFSDDGTKNIYNNIIINNKTTLETILNNPISIITLKGYNSLSNSVKQSLAEHIGTLVMDEGHRLGAKTFYPILEELPAKYRLLLTATFRRKDEMVNIMRYSFGDVFSLPNQLPKAHLYFVRTGVRFTSLLPKDKFKNLPQVESEIESQVKCYNSRNYLAYSGKITKFDHITTAKDRSLVLKYQNNIHNVDLNKFLAEAQSRRRKLISLIRKSVSAGRKVLVASIFLDLMYEIQKAIPDINTFVLDGDTNAKLTPDQLEKVVAGKDVIFGSMKVVEEGMDIDWLDTLIVYLPKSDIEQLTGRTTRILPKKPIPRVYYFMDNIPFCFSMAKKCREFDDNFTIRGTFEFSDIIKTI